MYNFCTSGPKSVQTKISERMSYEQVAIFFADIAYMTHTANVYRELWGTCRENLQYLWKRAVRITEKPYTPQRERLRILWRNPVIFTDWGEIL